MLPPALLLALLAPQTGGELAPLDPLVGHCWQGRLNRAEQQIATHCFDRTEDGQVRDRLRVEEDGKLVYSGDTLYSWDAAKGAIAFTYSSGNVSIGNGHVRPIPGGFDFGSADYQTSKGPVTISSRWLFTQDGGLDMIDDAPAAPEYAHTTRYARLD